MILYAQTTGNLSTNSGSWTPIPGLSLQMPEGINVACLIVLNVPNPYASGNDFPGGNFGILVEGNLRAPIASFTYSEAAPSTPGRVPITLSVPATLGKAPVTVTAVWSGIRGSTVHIDSPSSLAVMF